MTSDRPTAFLGTCRSGLGHLRRIASIAGAMRARAPTRRIGLITNAAPAGLPAGELAAFTTVIVCERAGMAAELAAGGYHTAVLDTLQLPGIGAFRGSAVLVLRETPPDRIAAFRRDDGRPWDRVIVPNPAAHWLPATAPGFARSIDTAGWIYRPTGPRAGDEASTGIVVATGGGGTHATRAGLYPLLDEVIARARSLVRSPVRIRQALGPRAGSAALSQADEVFDPGGGLNRVLRAADLVLSTAGYNSVLELATTDTPTLLAAIPRSLDDQEARLRLWGPKLGFALDPARPDAAAAWLADRIDRPRRRPPVDLGDSGAERAAALIEDTPCPVS